MIVKSKTVAGLGAFAICFAALAAGAAGAGNTVSLKVSPNPAPVATRVAVTLSGTISEPGIFEVADYQGQAGRTCAQTLAGPSIEFGHKVSHVISAPGPFTFTGSYRTFELPTKEILCGVIFPDPSGLLREESGGPPIVASAIAELRYTVRRPPRHCKKSRHHRCKRHAAGHK